MRNNNKGFTLVELIVVMAVFIVIIIIASDSFNTIIKQNAKLVSSEESNIEGIVGLEIFRHDLEQAGFGLPSAFPATPPQYDEASEAPANAYNEQTTSPETALPRPFVAGNQVTAGGVLANTDYLAIKGTTLGLTPASQRWTYVNYSSSGKPPKTWPSNNLVTGDRAIVLKRIFTSSGVTNQLVYNTATPESFFVNIPSPNAPLPSSFSPSVPNDMYTIYGVDTANLRMPFNRSDYFVMRPVNGIPSRLPSRCSDGTGILYKTVVNQNGGSLTYIPLLDCVADMQVVFGWDLDGDGLIDTYSNADGSSVSGLTSPSLTGSGGVMEDAVSLRNSLKLVKVYILAQDGARDSNFTNSGSTILVGSRENGESSLTRTFNLNPVGGPNLMNYRWKVYRIIVRPKNLSTQ